MSKYNFSMPIRHLFNGTVECVVNHKGQTHFLMRLPRTCPNKIFSGLIQSVSHASHESETMENTE